MSIHGKTIPPLLECLKAVPFAEVLDWQEEPFIDGVRPDGIVRVRLPKAEKTLIVEAKENGQPRHARAAVNQLLRFELAIPGAYGVFIAPYISPSAADICRQEGIGYVDLAGNCFLSFDEVYIEREGRPNPFSEKSYLRSLYFPKAERVLRVLLAHAGRRWTITNLAAEADVSIGHVHKVKELLTGREWLDVTADGVALAKPELLLAEWSQNYRFARNGKHNYYSMKPVNEIETAIGDTCLAKDISFALTGFSGSARLGHILLPDPLSRWGGRNRRRVLAIRGARFGQGGFG